MKRKRHLFWIIPVILLTLACTSSPLLRSMGENLIVQDPLEKADLITASSGPEYRIVYAAELYKQSYGAILFYTGGYHDDPQRSEASWSKYVATITGVPEEAIVIDDRTVTSTYDEAVIFKRIYRCPSGYRALDYSCDGPLSYAQGEMGLSKSIGA